MMLYAIVFATAIFAGMVQTSTGFGAGVLLLLVLPAFFDMLTAPAISSSICLALSTLLAIKYRKHFLPKQILLPTILYTSLSIVFVRLAKSLELSHLSIMFGAFLIALSAYYLIFQNRVRIKQSLGSALLCSSISGIFGGLFAIGGPLTALYVLETTNTWEEYLANIQFLFMTTTICSLIARIANGIYTAELIPYTAIGIFGVILGKQLGERITNTFRMEKSKKIIYLCVGLSGVVTIVKEFIR